MAMTRHGEKIILSEINEPTDIIMESAGTILFPCLFEKAKGKLPCALGSKGRVLGSSCDLYYIPQIFVRYLKNEDVHRSILSFNWDIFEGHSATAIRMQLFLRDSSIFRVD